jgi:hypothetical protein
LFDKPGLPKRGRSSLLAVVVTGVVALVSAGSIGAAYVGGDRSSETGASEPLLGVSQAHSPGSVSIPEPSGQSRQQPENHQVGPAHLASPAPSQIRAQPPVEVMLPSGARLPVLPAATSRAGVLQVPEDIGRAGWWDGSSRIGDPFGSIVVAAHVDSFTQGIGKFAELLDMHPGDEVQLDSADMRQMFRVVWAHLEPKTSLATDSRVFAADGGGRLVLITCGGAYDPDLGGYLDNMVVIATPERAPEAR